MTKRSSIHPFTGALYQLTPEGDVAIRDGERSGLFTREGRWISGELRECDPQLCVWVANNPQQPPAADSHLAAES